MEGASDFYRDGSYQGGIRSTFWDNWYDMQVKTVQYGVGETGGRDPNTGLLICGDDLLDAAELAANRTDLGADIAAHPFYDSYHRDRSADWDAIDVPVLSCGNWGGQGLHLRGNVEGFVRAASGAKWLEMHGHAHWPLFYTDYGVDLQKRFFDRYLKDEANGWEDRPAVQLQVRHVDATFTERGEDAWPLPSTRWTKLHLDAAGSSLAAGAPDAAASAEFAALGDGVEFSTPPLTEETEITGPLAARLYVSSSTTDADLFLVVRVYSPTGDEVVFQGALDPHTPVAQGWLRASRRRLDPELSTAHRPYHLHDRADPLEPGRCTRSTSRSCRPVWSSRPGTDRAPGAGQGLRLPGAQRPAVQPEERPHRLWAVPAQRRPRPGGGDVRRAHHGPHGRGPRVVSAAAGDSGAR